MNNLTKDFLKFLKEYKLFSLAVAFIMGEATSGLVSSLVKDILLPIAAPLLSIESWKTAVLIIGPITIAYGTFVADAINFIILALLIFLVARKFLELEKDESAAGAGAAKKIMPYKNNMPFLYTTRPFTKESKRSAIAGVLDGAVPDRDFYILVVGAVAFALCAIFTDSIAVLIASMIVAPLASPILALGLGITAGDARLMLRSLGMLVVSLIAAIVLAWIGTLLFGFVRVDPVFISFGGNLYIATIIALIAGAIAAYGFVRAKVGGAMTGIGIAVSLMPPLVATGVAIADANWGFAATTFTVFVLNVIGILVAASIVFIAFGLPKEYRAMPVSKK